MMVDYNEEANKTAYTVTVDYKLGPSTSTSFLTAALHAQL